VAEERVVHTNLCCLTDIILLLRMWSCSLFSKPYVLTLITFDKNNNNNYEIKQTLSAVSSISWFLAFSTSSFGPRITTLLLFWFSPGNLICTPPHSSITDRMRRPLPPISPWWYSCGISIVISLTFACQ